LAYLLSKTSLAHETIERRVKMLKKLAENADLWNADSVVKFLNESSWSNGTRNIAVMSYRDWLKSYGLPDLKLGKFYVQETLPFIPLEKELDSLIAAAHKRLACYLKLLKETGMRSIKAWSLQWSDIDMIQGTVTVKPAKRSKARRLKLSSQLLLMLGGLRSKSTGVWVWSCSGKKERLNAELSHWTRNWQKQRKRIAEKLQNHRLNQISLYTFRHWKATTEYLRTRDIFHVKELLGHKRIENTLRYVHVANAVSTQETRYVCKVAYNAAEAQALIEDSWEYITEMDGVKLFRKPK
jgi:integrase